MRVVGNATRGDRLIMAPGTARTGDAHDGEGATMSRRRAMRTFGVISGFIIVPAGLAGILLVGTASPAPAATTNPCAAQLTAASASPSATHTATPTPASRAPSSAPTTPSPTPTSKAPTSPPATPTTTPPTTSPPTSPTPKPSSSSPSPSTSSSSPSPSADHLCLSVQALASSVQAGGTARYAVWVWLAGKVNGTAKVSIAAGPGKLAPSFTVCATTGGTTCSVSLTANQAVELRAAVAVPKSAVGTHLTLMATGTSPQGAGASASGSVLVAAAGTPSGSPSGTPSSTPGVGVVLPGALPGGNLPLGVLPSGSLPLLPNPVTDPGVAFPQVTPTPDPSPVPAPTSLHVSDVSASFPLDTRLVGGQIIGLAVLATAVTIAVARFSLRPQRPPNTQDPNS
jgi:hypothetical protein